ncbi:MAG: SDR family oxidoreductase [Anaerolineales bacterium]|nr:SDR family oxidoreductase [Anaerolineales bacterium]
MPWTTVPNTSGSTRSVRASPTPHAALSCAATDDPDALLAQRLRRVPLGDMLYPDDMGRAAVFLCSADAAGITGASLVVDAGYSSCLEFTPP